MAGLLCSERHGRTGASRLRSARLGAPASAMPSRPRRSAPGPGREGGRHVRGVAPRWTPPRPEGIEVSCCGTCCATRGLTEDELVAHARVATIHDLAEATCRNDRVVSF